MRQRIPTGLPLQRRSREMPRGRTEPGKAKAPPGRSTELGQPRDPADEQQHPAASRDLLPTVAQGSVF